MKAHWVDFLHRIGHPVNVTESSPDYIHRFMNLDETGRFHLNQFSKGIPKVVLLSNVKLSTKADIRNCLFIDRLTSIDRINVVTIVRGSTVHV
jgi:hypothetical protein